MSQIPHADYIRKSYYTNFLKAILNFILQQDENVNTDKM